MAGKARLLRLVRRKLGLRPRVLKKPDLRPGILKKKPNLKGLPPERRKIINASHKAAVKEFGKFEETRFPKSMMLYVKGRPYSMRPGRAIELLWDIAHSPLKNVVKAQLKPYIGSHARVGRTHPTKDMQAKTIMALDEILQSNPTTTKLLGGLSGAKILMAFEMVRSLRNNYFYGYNLRALNEYRRILNFYGLAGPKQGK